MISDLGNGFEHRFVRRAGPLVRNPIQGVHRWQRPVDAKDSMSLLIVAASSFIVYTLNFIVYAMPNFSRENDQATTASWSQHRQQPLRLGAAACRKQHADKAAFLDDALKAGGRGELVHDGNFRPCARPACFLSAASCRCASRCRSGFGTGAGRTRAGWTAGGQKCRPACFHKPPRRCWR